MQPYAIGLNGGGLMALAGLTETGCLTAGERVRSFAIVTTEPNELCARLHNPSCSPNYGHCSDPRGFG